MSKLSELGNDLYTGKTSFDIVGNRRRWFAIAVALMVISVLVLVIRGLNPGIDFRGGSQFTVAGASTLDQALAQEVVEELGGEPARVAVVGADSLRVQTAELSSEQTAEVRAGLAEAYDVPVEDVTSTFIGPTWGADVTTQALWSLAIFLALVSIVMVAYFRAWTFAVGAIGALVHDLVLTVGIYAAVGFEVTPASVIGFLTILGYSLYDTVVVFDKVRENNEGVLDQEIDTYAERSNLAVNQTLVRSINTSITGLLPVLSILVVGVLLLGAGTLRDISLALFVGMLLSTVSSVLIAAPLEVELRERTGPYREHTARVLAARADGAGQDGAPVAAAADDGEAEGDLAGAAAPAESRQKRKRRR